MQKFIYLTLLCLSISCSGIKEEIVNKELYEITDAFVDSLQTRYKSYGVFGSKDNIKITNDSNYQIMPIGRLINVKILEVVKDEVYQELKQEFELHYKDDKRVNKVYISNAGTIMIDCRN